MPRHSQSSEPDARRVNAASIEGEVTLYEVLGISEDAAVDEIKRAYRKMILEYHPDKNVTGNREESTRMFKRIQEAYEVLTDTQRRRHYDSTQRRRRREESATEIFTAHASTSTSSDPNSPQAQPERKSFSFMFTSSLSRSFSLSLSSGSDVLWSFTTRGGGASSTTRSDDRESDSSDSESTDSREKGRRYARYVINEDGVQEFMT